MLAIKKLDKSASGHLSDAEFLELVSRISKLHHPNIVELVGYCLEHGQRLLVYNYCRNGTLHEALHVDEEMKKKLTWNARMRLALQAAKSLEYVYTFPLSLLIWSLTPTTNLTPVSTKKT